MLASRNPPLTMVKTTTYQTVRPGTTASTRPAARNTAPGSRMSLTTRTGSDRDAIIDAALGPDWSTLVTMLTSQPPLNSATSQTGTSDRCHATVESAATKAIC